MSISRRRLWQIAESGNDIMLLKIETKKCRKIKKKLQKKVASWTFGIWHGRWINNGANNEGATYLQNHNMRLLSLYFHFKLKEKLLDF